MNRLVLVIGMHRAGTSLVARQLHEFGLLVDLDIMGPDDVNPEGYFENQAVSAINEDLLQRAGGSWSNPVMTGKTDGHVLGEMEKVFGFCERDMWMWKDPRFAFTFHTWEPLLRTVDILFIVCYRNPEAIVKSMLRTHSHMMEPEQRKRRYLYDLVKRYYNACDELIKGHPSLSVQYERMESNTFFNPKVRHFW